MGRKNKGESELGKKEEGIFLLSYGYVDDILTESWCQLRVSMF